VYEFKFSHVRFRSRSVYGKLNWVLAFAQGGPLLCNGSLNFSRPFSFLVLRFVMMTFLVVVALWSISGDWNGGKWLAKLTNWQTAFMAVYGVMSFASAVVLNVKYGDVLHAPTPHESNARVSFLRMPWYVTVTWVFQNLSITFGLWVTVSFWILVNPLPEFNVGAHPENVVDHGITFLAVVLDFFASRMPYPLMMWFWSLVISAVYVVVTVALYYGGYTNDWNGERYVYPQLSWAPQDVDSTLKWIVPTVLFINPGVAVVVWFASLYRAAMPSSIPFPGQAGREMGRYDAPSSPEELRQTAFERMRVPWIREQGAGAGRVARMLAAERIARNWARWCCCCSLCCCPSLRRRQSGSRRVLNEASPPDPSSFRAYESPAHKNVHGGSAFSSSASSSSLTPFSSSAIAQYMGKTSRVDDSRATPELAARR